MSGVVLDLTAARCHGSAVGKLLQDSRDRVAAHWDGVTVAAPTLRTRFWQSPTIRTHINRRCCGLECEGESEGAARRLAALLERSGRGLLPRAVSVGGGSGHKEMLLLRLGLVEHFDLFELSKERIRLGREAARAVGLEQRITFREQDAFECARPESYDLVHWNNALHHMFDVEHAVAWSHRVLVPSGIFYMDDFVGPSRFQWGEPMLRAASAVRSQLPERFLRDPRDASRILPREIKRPNPETLAKHDPSEAVQSSRIPSAILTHFPDADLIFTGGVVYQLALSDVIANFDESDPEDRARLQGLLLADDALVEAGVPSLYAVALAIRSGPEAGTLRRWRARSQGAVADFVHGGGVQRARRRLSSLAKGLRRLAGA